MAQPQKIIVGLGNPGADYSFNRHNIGFIALDTLAEETHANPWQKKFKGFSTSVKIGDFDCLLLKPQTYMNLSGESAGEAMRYFKLKAEDIYVIHDDIDLMAAQVKVKQGGGHGGHNGLRSLDSHLTKDYYRIRLGVGHPGEKHEVTNHVLGNFAKSDSKWLDPLMSNLPNALPLLLKGDQGKFIQKLIS